MPRLVLFDLDGTLADTAPDLGGALNAVRAARGLPALELARLAPAIGVGTAALLEVGLNLGADEAGFAAARAEFLDRYAARVAAETRLYPDMDELLDALDAMRLDWGVVTNKPAQFTAPLLAALGLARRAVCVVSGDTLPERKPHPAPLLHAAGLAGHAPADAVYLGDAPTDIEAARAAGMAAVVAAWGYLERDAEPLRWGADAVVTKPGQFANWLLARLGARRD